MLPKHRHRPNKAEDTRSTLVVPALLAPSVTAPTPTTVPVTHEGTPAPPRPFKSAPANYIIRRINSTLNLPPRPPPGTSRTFRDPEIDSVCPILDHTILGRAQRESYYNTLDRILGPADGIQEGVGSYKSHLERQMAIYYGRLLPSHDYSLDRDLRTAPTIETCSPQLTSPTNSSTNAFQAPELQYPSDEPAYDVSVSCELPVDLTACPPDDCNTWMPEVLAAMVAGALPDLCSALPVDNPVSVPINRLPQAKTVSYALDDQYYLSSSFLFSQPIGPVFNSSSSSLAGALDELPCLPVEAEQESRRKSKGWARPRMGRARAYSSGGGI